MGQTLQQQTELSGELIHWMVYHASTPNSIVLVPSFSRTDFKKYQPDTCSNDYELS